MFDLRTPYLLKMKLNEQKMKWSEKVLKFTWKAMIVIQALVYIYM